MLAPTGPAGGRIAVKKGHQARSKSPDAKTFRSLLVALRGGALRFRVIAIFRVIPEHPTGLADDDATTTTTTRNTKPASYAPARPVLRVRLACDGHGGAVILAVGRVAFVSCATPRGAGTNLNDRDAAAYGLCVCICDAPRGTGLFLSGSMIMLSIPRRLRGPTRAVSMRNPNNELANRTFDTTGGRVSAGGVLSVDGANRHPRPRR